MGAVMTTVESIIVGFLIYIMKKKGVTIVRRNENTKVIEPIDHDDLTGYIRDYITEDMLT